MKLRTLRNVFGLAAIGWILGNGTAFGQTATWLGGAEGQATLWSAANNWSKLSGAMNLGGPPAAGDVTVFDGASSRRAITVGGIGNAGTLRFTAQGGSRYVIGTSVDGLSVESPRPAINLTSRVLLAEVDNNALGATVNATINVGGSNLSRTITNNGTSDLIFAGGVNFQDSGDHTLSIGGVGGVQLSSLSSVSSSTLTVQRVDSTSGSVVVNGAVSGNVTVATGITVNGNVSASGGNLVVNGTVDSLSVQSGGILSGTGTVNSATIGNGGQHRPGTSPGLQTFTNLTYNSGSTFVWELGGTGNVRGTSFDAVNVTNLTVQSGAISRLVIDQGLMNNNTFWSTNQVWNVFSSAPTSGSSAFQIELLPSQSAFLNSRGNFSWNGGTLSFSAVPEPGTLALLGVVSTVGFGVARFRKRKNKAAA